MKETIKEKQFKALFEKYYTKLYYSSLAIVRDEDDARDIVNDVFAHIWEKHDSFEDTVNSMYLYTSIRHRSLDHLKKKKVRDNYANNYIKNNDEGFLYDDEEEERIRQIQKVIDKMPEKTKYVLDQCYMEGKRYMEVASDIGISRDGVRKHIVKALRLLREAFSKGNYSGRFAVLIL